MTEERASVESPVPPFGGNRFQTSSDETVSRFLLQAKSAAERYVAAQFGRVKLVVRNLILLTLFGAMVFLATATFAVVAVVQICAGAAGAIGAFLGNRLWAGELIVGLAILGGTCTFCWFATSRIRSSARQKAMDEYFKINSHPVER